MEEAKLIPDRNDFSAGEDGEQAFDSAFAEAVNFSFNGRGGNLSEMLVEQDEFVWQRFDAADKGVGIVARAQKLAKARVLTRV